MKTIYESTESPAFLDSNARLLLHEAREAYLAYDLQRNALVEYQGNVALFCWAGDRALNTLLIQLRDRDIPVERDGIALIVNGISASELASHIRSVAAQGPADAVELAATIKNKLIEKHHVFLNEELLSIDYASCRLEPEAAWHAAVRVSAQLQST
jgi:ATP-dependent Lhr-like helicase